MFRERGRPFLGEDEVNAELRTLIDLQALDSKIASFEAEVAKLPRALSDAAGVVLDGTGYLVGGEASLPLRSIIAIRPD